MAVVFEAIIQNVDDKSWQIKLIDTVDGRSIVCPTLDEFMQQIEIFGSDYGGSIDEVKWSLDDDVPPYFVDEVRLQMAEYQKKLDEGM